MSTRSMVAAHIFPWKSSQDAMVAIFGSGADGELFAPNNGMLIPFVAEKFDNGALMLVPRVSDLASACEIRAWNEAEIKQYKIGVIRPKDADMNKFCHPSSDKTWKDLDNEPVTFKGTSAPEQGTSTTRIVQPCCVELIISSHGTRPCKTRWAR